MDRPLWIPSDKRIKACQLQAFLTFINHTYHLSLTDYEALWQWSVSDKAKFWQAIWQFFNLHAHTTAHNTLKEVYPFYKSRWFEGMSLNFAENLLKKGNPAQTALCFISETGHQHTLSYAELRIQTARLANQLRRHGIGQSSRVAGVLPNCVETVVAMLATTSLGAIWSSCSPDFGSQGLLDRLSQIEPQLLFTVDSYLYNGKRHDVLGKISTVVEKLPSVQQTVVVPFVGALTDISHLPNGTWFNDFLSDDANLRFEPVPFAHPLYILYSSGTTGMPKCIVHGTGGTLLQHVKELGLHTDITAQDTVFYFTTCSWMMWNWMISALALGATVVLYDGCPSYPNPSRLLDIVAEENVTVFGCGAKYIETLAKHHKPDFQSPTLPALKTILSTGSPLSPQCYDYVYGHIKKDVQLSSISGGTDIISCFALGNPLLPVYRGELQCLGLGMDVAVFDEQGQPISGRKGELVCQSPFPSMPIGFWHDPEDEKYHQAYFARFDNTWTHGDYAQLVKHPHQRGLIIYGRSDAVLNPGGVRIGTAEIYRQLEHLPQIVDSVVVGQPWQGDERIILFVQLQPRLKLDNALSVLIKQHIRTRTTPRHVPAKILDVTAIPRTLNGKVVELAVKQIICGEAVCQRSALINPECLEEFKNRPELLT